MYFGQVCIKHRRFQVHVESLNVYMSRGRLERTTSAILKWLSKRKMRRIFQCSDIYLMENDILCCRIYKRLESLNKLLDDELDGLAIEFDFQADLVHIRLYAFELE